MILVLFLNVHKFIDIQCPTTVQNWVAKHSMTPSKIEGKVAVNFKSPLQWPFPAFALEIPSHLEKQRAWPILVVWQLHSHSTQPCPYQRHKKTMPCYIQNDFQDSHQQQTQHRDVALTMLCMSRDHFVILQLSNLLDKFKYAQWAVSLIGLIHHWWTSNHRVWTIHKSAEYVRSVQRNSERIFMKLKSGSMMRKDITVPGKNTKPQVFERHPRLWPLRKWRNRWGPV